MRYDCNKTELIDWKVSPEIKAKAPYQLVRPLHHGSWIDPKP